MVFKCIHNCTVHLYSVFRMKLNLFCFKTHFPAITAANPFFVAVRLNGAWCVQVVIDSLLDFDQVILTNISDLI